MSEYQYYEFQTVDRRLTDKQMGELRSYSSRAHMTVGELLAAAHGQAEKRRREEPKEAARAKAPRRAGHLKSK